MFEIAGGGEPPTDWSGVPLLVGHGDAPRRLGVAVGGADQVAGQGRVIQSWSKYT